MTQAAVIAFVPADQSCDEADEDHAVKLKSNRVMIAEDYRTGG